MTESLWEWVTAYIGQGAGIVRAATRSYSSPSRQGSMQDANAALQAVFFALWIEGYVDPVETRLALGPIPARQYVETEHYFTGRTGYRSTPFLPTKQKKQREKPNGQIEKEIG